MTLLPQERYNDLLLQLKEQKMIKVEEIMARYQISIETARRDLTALEKLGKIKKIYGGAALVEENLYESAADVRLMEHEEEKVRIGKKCSEFIHDGDAILLEIGTTTLQVARHIKQRKNLTVITNSIYIVNELIGTNIDLYVIGGKIRHEEKALSGAISTSEIENFNISKAIIGAGAVTAQNGISDYNIEEALIRKKIIARAKETYLVADHSKFGFDSLVNVCPITSLDLIITDSGLSPEETEAFHRQGANLIVV
ncbi:MAG: DeoR/GlpR family DNA-binding transcription regulator [Anaerovoracaceae bacterium]